IDIHDVPALTCVVGERAPWERMVAIADAEETAEAHDGVFRAAGLFIDHYVVNATELLTSPVVDIRPFNLAGRDQPPTCVRRVFDFSHHRSPLVCAAPLYRGAMKHLVNALSGYIVAYANTINATAGEKREQGSGSFSNRARRAPRPPVHYLGCSCRSQ